MRIRARPGRLAVLLSALMLVSLACEAPLGQDANRSVTQTLEAVETIVAAATRSIAEPSAPAVVTPPQVTVEVLPSPTPTLTHLTVPGEPGSPSSFMTDSSSRILAPEHRSIGDNFLFLGFERPFTAEVMDWQPHLDLIRGELDAAAPWLYVTLFVEEEPPVDAAATYAVEFDLDLDGRGDTLVTATLPLPTAWTTENVRIYRDDNNDVGQLQPLRAEAPPPTGDGYEILVFDHGYGYPDPDAAWARISPFNGRHIQIAIKHALIDDDAYLLWGIWADGGLQDPARFYYHDQFTLEQAGSPLSTNSSYPLDQLPSLDNTCRWTFNFTPTEPLPGLCALPPEPGSIGGVVWLDTNGNGTREGVDPGQAGYTVVLRSGGCSGSVVGTMTTVGAGHYSFSGLMAGDYCVFVEGLTCGCGGWCILPSYSNPRSVSLGEGENKNDIDFGIRFSPPC